MLMRNIYRLLYGCVVLSFLSGAPLLTGGDVMNGADDTSISLVADSSVQENEDGVVQGGDDDDIIDPNMEPFIPTKEWQTVKRGQSIPAGLHVRMNLQTKSREAKLMDGDDGAWLHKNTEIKTTIQKPEVDRAKRMQQEIEHAMKDLNMEEDTEKNRDLKFTNMEGINANLPGRMTKQELKDALKKLKVNQDDVKNPDELPRAESYRSADELKEELDKLNLSMKTDTEIMREYLKVYQKSSTGDEAKVGLLNNLEYYLHQIDNGIDFVDMGGLDVIISELNNTLPDIRSESALVLGSVAQSNPYVQNAAVHGGALTHLSRLLTLETSGAVLSRALYALSSVIRSQPVAQAQFFTEGGIHTLTRLFDSSLQKTEPQIHKPQLKAVTLIEDLIEEKTLFEKYLVSGDKVQEEKLELYKKVNFSHLLVDHHWCQHISSLLSLPSHDSREKVLTAMFGVIDTCHTTDSNVLITLRHLRDDYVKLSKEEVNEPKEDQYFTQLLTNVERLLSRFELIHTDL